MSTVNPNQHQSARRALRLLCILQGNAFDGLRLKQIAEALQVADPTALRDLNLLADEGFAERIPGKEESWRLTPKVIQVARAHDDEMRRVRERIENIDQRYTRAL